METYQIVLIVIYFIINAILATLYMVSIYLDEGYLTLGSLMFLITIMLFALPIIIIGILMGVINSLLPWNK